VTSEQAIAVIVEKRKQSERLLEEANTLAEQYDIRISEIDSDTLEYNWDSSRTC
jgi:PP-loop superfamily ATP-utilizing enzyme